MAAAAAMAQLRFSPLSGLHRSHYHTFQLPRHPSTPNPNISLSPLNIKPTLFSRTLHLSFAGGGGDGVGRGGRGDGGGGGGGGGDNSGGGGSYGNLKSGDGFGVLGAFVNGWRSRVAADPQFPFKVLMEELVGVSACVVGDMATRPNFGLNELDFVFSTLVVGCILNFTLMYLLAPTSTTLSSSTSHSMLPSIFASCPTSHMFEAGPYSLMDRLGTLLYKGAVFAAVGLVAGLVGTAISNGLILMRKKMDPSFETPNKAPPTVLNALTWAGHMGVSSNLRYQTLNGIEFLLEKALPPLAFKSSILAFRLLNNVVGGMTFVLLARITGSQAVSVGVGEHHFHNHNHDDNHHSASASATSFKVK